MSTLLASVNSRLVIHTRLASSHPLDGGYASLQRGRSLDVEDLRGYEHGDDVRDIAWRASAQHGEILVKRSRATRQHTVLFAVDTGRGMAALAPDERPKRDLAVLAVGSLGLLAIRHGDGVSVMHGDAAGVSRLPTRRSEGGLEVALRRIRDAATSDAAASSRERLLDEVVRTVRRRTILVVVTGEDPLTAAEERLARRLRVQHDLLWITLRDADPVAPHAPRVDVDSGWRVPDHLRGNARIRAALDAERAATDEARRALLGGLEISHAELSHAESAVPRLLSMLARRPRVGA